MEVSGRFFSLSEVDILLFILRRCDMKGVISRYSGNAMKEEIFLWKRLECSNRCNVKANKVKHHSYANDSRRLQEPSSGSLQLLAISSWSTAWLTLGSLSNGSIWFWLRILNARVEWISLGSPIRMLESISNCLCCPELIQVLYQNES